MKKRYRIAAMLLAGLMLFGAAPLDVFAEEAESGQEYAEQDVDAGENGIVPLVSDEVVTTGAEDIAEGTIEEETIESETAETRAAAEGEPVISEAANSLTRAQVQAWLDNQIAAHQQIGSGECVAFCNYYLTNCWGVSAIGGNANAWGCPQGFYEVNLSGNLNNAQLGDLMVTRDGTYGHVAVYYGAINATSCWVVDQNHYYNGTNERFVGKRTWYPNMSYISCYRPNFNNDTTPPTISNVQVSQDYNGYTVTCTVSDSGSGVNRVQFPSWTLSNDQDDIDPSWGTSSTSRGTQNGNTWSFRVNRSSHNNEFGTYRTHIYAFDNAGNSACIAASDVTFVKDTTAPTIFNIRVVSQDINGYTVSCRVTDSGSGVDRVQFPSWTLYNDQDDLDGSWTTSTTSRGTRSGDTWTFRVNRSSHNYEYGVYRTHIYAYDAAGNRTKGIVSDVAITFSDTRDSSQFYFDPVIWAANEGITTGFSDGSFHPWETCNRAAVVTFLWRLAGKPSVSGAYPFSDPTTNSEFNTAITWAVRRGIVTGYSDGTFRPWATCNRAAIVTFLWRYAGRPSAGTSMSFSDMTGNSDFDTAIRWAARNGITTGYSNGTFRPWNDCNRASVVTFLYRYAHL